MSCLDVELLMDNAWRWAIHQVIDHMLAGLDNCPPEMMNCQGQNWIGGPAMAPLQLTKLIKVVNANARGLVPFLKSNQPPSLGSQAGAHRDLSYGLRRALAHHPGHLIVKIQDNCRQLVHPLR